MLLAARDRVKITDNPNKGLEVIEARWLFGLAPSQIDVVVHRQSIVHSLVGYVDGSVLAQLSNPDMRTPIAGS